MSGKKKILIYCQGSLSHGVTDALDVSSSFGKERRISIITARPGGEPPEWAEVYNPSALRDRRMRRALSRPDLMVLAISNDPESLTVKGLFRMFLAMLVLRPRKIKIFLHAWSGRYSSAEKTGEVLRKLAVLLLKPVRLLLIKILFVLLKKRRAPVTPKKILFICPDMIGDFIWTVPAIKSIQRAFPDSRSDLLVHPTNRQLAETAGDFGKVIEYDAPWLRKIHYGNGKYPRRKMFKNMVLRFSIFREGYAAAISFRGGAEEMEFSMLTGAQVQAGFIGRSAGVIKPEEMSCLLTHALPDPVINGETVHVLERNLKLARALGAADENVEVPWLNVPKEADEAAESLLKEHGLTGKPLIAIQPGASRPEKRWGREKFNHVARTMAERGFSVAALGTAGESSIGDAVVKGVPDAANLCGRTDLLAYAAIIKRCALVICNESSAISMASALGVPALAVMSGSPEIYGPWGTGGAGIINLLPCRNLAGEHCICARGYRCLQEIGAKEVLEKAYAILTAQDRTPVC